jgi:adenylosuccinate lyase
MKRNLESTRGLVFSQRVLLTLIDKGISRERAYELVQRNAMKAWDEDKDFLTLLEADSEIADHLSSQGLRELFDYDYYLRFVHVPFERLGLDKKNFS